MSSGCYHPKISFPAGRVSSRPFPAIPPPGVFPIWGTKNLSADLITFNSATQTFVNSQPFYLGCAGCQNLFSTFLPELLTRNCNHFTNFSPTVKNFIQFFSAPEPIPFTKNGCRNYMNPESVQYFFETFFQFFSGPRVGSHLCPKSPGL